MDGETEDFRLTQMVQNKCSHQGLQCLLATQFGGDSCRISTECSRFVGSKDIVTVMWLAFNTISKIRLAQLFRAFTALQTKLAKRPNVASYRIEQISTHDSLLNSAEREIYPAHILTFISRINTTSQRFKARKFFICSYFSFYEQLKFVLS